MDTRNYTWVNTFEPESTFSTPMSPTTSSKTLTTVGISIGVILGTAIFMTAGFFGYKWYQRKRQNEIIRIHGSHI